MTTKPIARTVLLGLGLAGAALSAVAGTGGGEFQTLYNMLFSWTTGFLGKAIALFAFLLGAGMGVARSNIMPALIGIVFALVLTLGPNIIAGMFTAVI